MQDDPPIDAIVEAAPRPVPVPVPVPVPIRLLNALAPRLRDGRLTTGEASALRRLDPAGPDRRHLVPLIRVLAEAGIDGSPGSDAWPRLVLIANTIALARGLHEAGEATGAALYAIGVSEQRLMALVSADFASLCDLLPRIARRASAAGQAMDFRPLAQLTWTADRHEEAADDQRRRIASAWLRAAAREKSAA
jgi:hypothetical protein